MSRWLLKKDCQRKMSLNLLIFKGFTYRLSMRNSAEESRVGGGLQNLIGSLESIHGGAWGGD